MSTKQWISGMAMLAASSVALAFSAEFQTADFGFVPSKSRTQVIRELEQAQADGSYQALHSEALDTQAWSTMQGSGGQQTASTAVSTRLVGTMNVRAVALKDGSTVYVFNDGKMGMEGKYGRAERMAPGHVMEARDGRAIMMVGDEVARVDALHQTEYPGGR